jgi:hypothetical protein
VFLGTLSETVERVDWLCHASCQMNSHYPAVMETPWGNLSIGTGQRNGVALM